ncbi:MAG TPA: DUF167 domain-containing protein [Abditibacteriaceae bacterium]|jgi:hypothetical protein
MGGELVLSEDKGATLLPVRAKPRGRKNAIEGVRDGALIVSVTAPPTDGEANSAVIDVLSKAMHWPKSALDIFRGHKSRDKTIRISGLTIDEVRARLGLVADI